MRPRTTAAPHPRGRPRRTRAVALLLLAGALAGCGRQEPGDSGGAATGDDLRSAEAGSKLSNDSARVAAPVNDTLPGRDSRVTQPAGQSGPGRP